MIKNSKLQNLFKLSSKVTVKVIDLCGELKEEMTQDAIALEINGEMYFI